MKLKLLTSYRVPFMSTQYPGCVVEGVLDFGGVLDGVVEGVLDGVVEGVLDGVVERQCPLVTHSTE